MQLHERAIIVIAEELKRLNENIERMQYRRATPEEKEHLHPNVVYRPVHKGEERILSVYADHE